MAVSAVDAATRIYRALMSHAVGEGNDHAFACMIASWQVGDGSMPDWLGLSPAAFHCLMLHHFPGASSRAIGATGLELRDDRLEEVEELVQLMLIDKAGESPSEVWMGYVVATGCMAPDHLWQDLGLWSRKDLTALMRRNFPALAALNVKDMKWKKFLYKKLCESEGIYACRAPSCEACTDYYACFAPEH